MSISDERFEAAMEFIGGYTTMVADLRARDTAQREALARVEADNRQLQLIVNSHANMRDTAQAQLAEAVGALEFIQGALCLTDAPMVKARINQVLARQAQAQAEQQEVCWKCGGTGEADTGGVMPWGAPAMATCPCQRESQAEQQEARNAEVARESLRPENQRIEPVEPLSVPHPLEAHGAQAGDERAAFEAAAQTFLSGLVQLDFSRFADDSGYTSSTVEWGFRVWQKRAALATQTAAGEPVDLKELKSALFAVDIAIKFALCNRDLIGTREDVKKAAKAMADLDDVLTRFVAAPPAAAHGDEAVRKDAEAAYVEMTCQPVLIDGATHYYLSSERMQAFDRLFSVDVSDAAMRAQGEGGEA